MIYKCIILFLYEITEVKKINIKNICKGNERLYFKIL